MNQAKKDLIKRDKRNQALANFICWTVLAGCTFLIGKLLLAYIRLFFSL